MKNDLTLVIMAAGKGSRYGGSKQTDSLGLNGESIMDFSIYDACLAGFNKIVFIIQDEQQDYFQKKYHYLTINYEVKYAVQDIRIAPFDTTEIMRVKPWGTTHACWSAHKHIQSPFCILNADDYYGRTTFFRIAEFLRKNDCQDQGVFVAYKLTNTISKHGSVSRGVCSIQDGKLKQIHEYLSIELIDNKIIAKEEILDPTTPVSMNIWGLQPKVIQLLENQLKTFGKELSDEDQLTKEALLPSDIQSLIEQELLSIETIYADEEWFGITYKDDKEFASQKLQKMQIEGYYPRNLLTEKII